MPDSSSILILSDVHYAGPAEKQRGWRETDFISNPVLRLGLRAYRRFIWRSDPFAHNYLLDRFFEKSSGADYVIANGDYSCDSAFVGLSDEASYQSAEECVGKLRRQFGAKLHLTIGDHELGKTSLFGGQGGMRFDSWSRVREGLKVPDFWQIEIGSYVIIGIVSSLVALPVYEPETLQAERAAWNELRHEHLTAVGDAFARLRPSQRVILFCHDPTALPFLWRDERVRSRIDQVSATVIGHLHSEFYLMNSRILSGMPTLRWFGTSIRRMSAALSEARHWKPFKVRLCPALAGIELLKDGGYLSLELPNNPELPVRIQRHRLKWEK